MAFVEVDPSRGKFNASYRIKSWDRARGSIDFVSLYNSEYRPPFRLLVTQLKK
jgi:hypothetical protein